MDDRMSNVDPKLLELLVCPLTKGPLRYDAERMAHRGIPRIAPPETAQRILIRLQELSAAYGTTIAIEDDIGVIRP